MPVWAAFPGQGLEWAIAVAYVVVALLCVGAARSARAAVVTGAWGDRSRVALFWVVAAAGLLLLGANKPLDLHDLLTDFGRRVARAQGWYDARRGVQIAFVAVLTIGGLVGLKAIWRLASGDVRRLWIALVGVGILALFVLLRAAAIHHVPVVSDAFGDLSFGWLLEVAGIACVAVCAARATRAQDVAGARAGGPPWSGSIGS